MAIADRSRRAPPRQHLKDPVLVLPGKGADHQLAKPSGLALSGWRVAPW